MISVRYSTVLALTAASLVLAVPAWAEKTDSAAKTTAAATDDPVALKLMQGFPPPPERLVTRANIMKFPNQRWAFHHMRELQPTANVWRGDADNVKMLDEEPAPVKDIEFEDADGKQRTVDDWLQQTDTDGFLVLHEGDIAFETYGAGMQAHEPHILFSVTKSITGLLAADLVARGQIDPSAQVTKYVPELADSAWGDATVQQTLDMTTAIKFNEDYADTGSDIYRYAFAGGMVPAPKGYDGPQSMYAYLPTLQKDGEHGERFTYRTVNSEVLGWIVQRVTGQPFNELVSERIWQKLGAENDAYAWVDSQGTALMGAGMNVTLRDLGRFADMVRQNGRYNGNELISPEAIETIAEGADREKYAKSGHTGRVGYSYHDQWWITHNADNAIEAWGIYGQIIHINPTAKVTIVKLSSNKEAGNERRAATDIRAFKAIADALGDRTATDDTAN